MRKVKKKQCYRNEVMDGLVNWENTSSDGDSFLKQIFREQKMVNQLKVTRST